MYGKEVRYMLRIGEFSKLSHLTIKALRFYEKEGLLSPAKTDPMTGYRYYTTSQLEQAAEIRAYRQLNLSINEIRSILSGADRKAVLQAKAESLTKQRDDIEVLLSVIHNILEEENMNYQVTVKQIDSQIVYYAETTLEKYSDMMQFIPMTGEECRKLNPGLKCIEPGYEFVEYLDAEHKETDIRVRHNEAVTERGVESELIHFREIPAVKVLSIFYKGHYDGIGDAYAFLMKYAEENGYQVNGLSRECYIDGIWNKESPDEWLTEIQLPIE